VRSSPVFFLRNIRGLVLTRRGILSSLPFLLSHFTRRRRLDPAVSSSKVRLLRPLLQLRNLESPQTRSLSRTRPPSVFIVTYSSVFNDPWLLAWSSRLYNLRTEPQFRNPRSQGERFSTPLPHLGQQEVEGIRVTATITRSRQENDSRRSLRMRKVGCEREAKSQLLLAPLPAQMKVPEGGSTAPSSN